MLEPRISFELLGDKDGTDTLSKDLGGKDELSQHGDPTHSLLPTPTPKRDREKSEKPKSKDEPNEPSLSEEPRLLPIHASAHESPRGRGELEEGLTHANEYHLEIVGPPTAGSGPGFGPRGGSADSDEPSDFDPLRQLDQANLPVFYGFEGQFDEAQPQTDNYANANEELRPQIKREPDSGNLTSSTGKKTKTMSSAYQVTPSFDAPVQRATSSSSRGDNRQPLRNDEDNRGTEDDSEFDAVRTGKHTLSWSNLKLASEESTILHGLSGHLVSGQMTALLGFSGSGKTSLLNLLAGRASELPSVWARSGKIALNGMSVDDSDLSCRIGMVRQEDKFYPEITVEEVLQFCGRLKLRGAAEEVIQQSVEEALGSTNLLECRNRRVGSSTEKGISGGERKRVSIAIELLSRPQLLLLDEPTSGLDSITAATVITVMRELADSGTLVVAALHQPSAEIFEMFDRLYLMRGGHALFDGPRSEAMQYWSNGGLANNRGERNESIDEIFARRHHRGSNSTIRRHQGGRRTSSVSSRSYSFNGQTVLTVNPAELVMSRIQALEGDTLLAEVADFKRRTQPRYDKIARVMKEHKKGALPSQLLLNRASVCTQIRALVNRLCMRKKRAGGAVLSYAAGPLIITVMLGAICAGVGNGRKEDSSVPLEDSVLGNFDRLCDAGGDPTRQDFCYMTTQTDECGQGTVAKVWTFMALVSMVYMINTGMTVIISMPLEHPILKRESSSNLYGATPYLLAKVIAEWPFTWCIMFISFLILKAIIPLQANFLVVAPLLLLHVGTCYSMTWLLLGDGRKAQSGQQKAILFFMTQFFISGILVPVNELSDWMQVVAKACHFKYFVNLFSIAEFGDNWFAERYFERQNIKPDLFYRYLAIHLGILVVALAGAILRLKRALTGNGPKRVPDAQDWLDAKLRKPRRRFCCGKGASESAPTSAPNLVLGVLRHDRSLSLVPHTPVRIGGGTERTQPGGEVEPEQGGTRDSNEEHNFSLPMRL